MWSGTNMSAISQGIHQILPKRVELRTPNFKFLRLFGWVICFTATPTKLPSYIRDLYSNIWVNLQDGAPQL